MTLARQSLSTLALTAALAVIGTLGLSTYAPIAHAIPLPPSDFNWTLVAGNDKRHARVQVLKTFSQALEKRL